MVILYYPQKQQVNNKVLTDLQGSLYLFFWKAFMTNNGTKHFWEMRLSHGKCAQMCLRPLAIQEINKSGRKVNCDKEKVGVKSPFASGKPNQRWCSFSQSPQGFPKPTLPHRIFHPLPFRSPTPALKCIQTQSLGIQGLSLPIHHLQEPELWQHINCPKFHKPTDVS